MRAVHSFLYYYVVLWTLIIQPSRAVEQHLITIRGDDLFPSQVQQCSDATGGGVCPLRNTCCLVPILGISNTHNKTMTSGCIPSDLGPLHATCCQDDQASGCGVGYRCSSDSIRKSCKATASIPYDPLVQSLPRYSPLCRISLFSDFQQLLGFASPTVFHNPTTRMLYYSSHPNLRLGITDKSSDNPDDKNDRQNGGSNSKIRMVLIVVHGANRNADDYFCAASAAIAKQNRLRVEQVLLLAPRFVVPSDLQTADNSTSATRRGFDNVLQWEDLPNGPWRYGADAIYPKTSTLDIDNKKAATGGISSFDVLDAMILAIRDMDLPHLEHVTVAGHSSGGQFVQRWVLLSPFYCNIDGDGDDGVYANANGSRKNTRIRSVVANPSSYAYLVPERYNVTTRQWSVPRPHNQQVCPDYNTWEWGLEISSRTPRYVRSVLTSFIANTATTGASSGDVNAGYFNPYQPLVDRFAKRNVLYLAGSLDRCNMTNEGLLLDDDNTIEDHQQETESSRMTIQQSSSLLLASAWWCQSHGLEVTCQDDLQGSERWERYHQYMQMLRRAILNDVIAPLNQRGVVVSGVGHDHSLMFYSPEGLEALFGYEENKDAEVM